MGGATKAVAEPRLSLSATEMVTLYGVSPYQGASEHQVYLEHVHPEAKAKEAESPRLWMRLGNAIEPLALTVLSQETGQLLRKSTTRVCEAHPWLVARADALVVEGEPEEDTADGWARSLSLPKLGRKGAKRANATAVVEAKFVSDPRMAKLWIDARPRPPLYVHVQAQAEMTVYNLPRATGIGIILGNPYIWELEHDPELEAEMLAIGENFLASHVKAKVPPEWDGSKWASRLLMARWPKQDGTFRRASLEENVLARTWLDLDQQIEKQKKEQAVAEQKLKDLIGDRLGLLADTWKVTWKANRMGRIAWKDIANALAGRRGVPEKVVEKHRGVPTKAFRLFERDKKLIAAGLATDDFDLDDLIQATASNEGDGS